MIRPVRRNELDLVTLDGRHTGELLAHPCPCPNTGCTSLGQHIWHSTRDMAPGLKAQAFEPPTTTPTIPATGRDTPPDPTATLHTDYQQLLTTYHNAARNLTQFIDRHRPDRLIPLPNPTSDDDWCRNHLTVIGICEPRHRGDLCRWCWEINTAHGTPPDRQYLHARRDRGRSTPRMETDFLARIRAGHPRTKRKAS